MGIRDEMKLKLRREIKEVLRKNPEEDILLGEGREPLLKGSRYGGVEDQEYVKRSAKTIWLFNRFKLSEEKIPAIARENKKDLRKFVAVKAKYGDDKALGFLARINPDLGKIIERDMRYNASIRAGGLAHPDGTITINTEEEDPDTVLHEIRHQVGRAYGWWNPGEMNEAFADVKSEEQSDEVTKMRAVEWGKTYGKFSARKYAKALRIMRFVERKYGTGAAVKLAKILNPNIYSIKMTLKMRFPRRKNKR